MQELQDQTMFPHTSSHNSINRLLTPPPPPIIQRDPKRQSQMLMDSKRRSLAIKDTDLLEQMLRGDLEGFEQYHPSEGEEEEEEESEDDLSKLGDSTRSASPTTITIEEIVNENDKKGTTTPCCLKCNGLPCTFPCRHSLNPTYSKKDDPFALFTSVTIVLGIASQFGVTDDWTVPITLATLVSGFLWSGSKNKKVITTAT